jgi:hypothetical protein
MDRLNVNGERHPVNHELETIRKNGYLLVEVRKSLVPGDSGQGLFAKKKIKLGAVVCSYEGRQISSDQLRQSYDDREYIASAIVDYRTKEMVYIYIDGEERLR